MATRRTTATLQPKLDRMLAKCIRDVRSLGYRPVGRIKPHVRITKNTRGIGQCRELTGAYYRLRGDKRGTRRLREGAKPVFEISCSVNAGSSDQEFLDTLYHEVIHTLPGCFSHGKEFKAVATRVNEAFGCSVTVTKQDEEPEGARATIDSLIGESFTDERGRRMTLVGTNPRARKNYCRLREDATGREYVCAPAYVLGQVALSDDADAETNAGDRQSGDEPSQQGRLRRNGDGSPYGFLTGDAARKVVAAMVGKVFVDGKTRLRLEGINSRAPKNCCRLLNLGNGKRYVAPPEYVLRLEQE